MRRAILAAVVIAYAVLACLAVLYWVVVGTTHSWVPAAPMLAAIRNDHRAAH